MPLLRSLGLLGLVDGIDLSPSPMIQANPTFSQAVASSPTSSVGSSIGGRINPQYQEWVRKDQLLLTWIMQSLLEDVLSSVTSVDTSYDAW